MTRDTWHKGKVLNFWKIQMVFQFFDIFFQDHLHKDARKKSKANIQEVHAGLQVKRLVKGDLPSNYNFFQSR